MDYPIKLSKNINLNYNDDCLSEMDSEYFF